MTDVAVLVGSLRRESINRKLALALGKLAAPRLNFRIVELGDVPMYNDDLWPDVPEAVLRMKREIETADAVPLRHPRVQPLLPGRPQERHRLGHPPLRPERLQRQAGRPRRHLAGRRRCRGRPEPSEERPQRCGRGADGPAGSLSRVEGRGLRRGRHDPQRPHARVPAALYRPLREVDRPHLGAEDLGAGRRQRHELSHRGPPPQSRSEARMRWMPRRSNSANVRSRDPSRSIARQASSITKTGPARIGCVKRGPGDAEVRRQTADEEPLRATLLEVAGKTRRRRPIGFPKAGIAVDPGLVTLAKNRLRVRNIERGVELGARASLNAMVGPQDLRSIGDVDRRERLAPMRAGERNVAGGVPSPASARRSQSAAPGH